VWPRRPGRRNISVVRDDDDATSDLLIELRLPARAKSIATVRAVAADVTSRADFDLDAISDVRMAVDEACTALARLASPTHLMRAVFSLDGGYLRVDISARVQPADRRIDTAGFGWHVLGSLTDELSTEHGTGVDGDEVIIRLAKKSAAG
jgi:serine/threonine-protein kinase RsbW